MKSNYIIQHAATSHCSNCQRTVDLLCREDGNLKSPWFYICWSCRLIAQVGKGEVRNENASTSTASDSN